MKYILSYIRENDYCSKFEYTACPDEHFMNGQYMFARKFDMNKDRQVISGVLNRS